MATKKEKVFDKAKLEGMVEPFSVRVVKLKGNHQQPLELPSKDGQAPGEGWTKDEILKLENWLLTEWSGGGYYSASVMDSSKETMEWTFLHDPKQYGERIPPNALSAASIPVHVQPVAQPQMTVVQPPVNPVVQSLNGNGGGMGIQFPYAASNTYYPPSTYQQPQPQQQVQPMSQQPVWSTPWQGNTSLFGDSTQNERKALEERIRQLELERQGVEYKVTLDRQQNSFNEQLRLLQEEMRRNRAEPDETKRLREELERQKNEMFQAQIASLREQLSVPKQSDEVQQLREEMRRQKEQFDREREQERLRAEMREQREQFERRMLEISAKPQVDPIIEIMRESQRTHAEALKEMARMQQSQVDKLSTFMINPIQVAQLVKETSSNTDGVTKMMVSSMTDIMGFYKNAMEQASNLSNPPESIGQQLLKTVSSRGMKLLDGYVSMKREEIEQQGKLSQTQMHVEAARLQADTQLKAQQQALQAQVAAAAIAPQAQMQGGLNGPPAQPQPQQAQQQQQAAPANPPAGKVIAMGPQRRPTEEEIFGEALESVNRLRVGVAEGNLSPTDAIGAIVKGINFAREQEVEILAFELVNQERWADFIDILLPVANQGYRDECARLLMKAVKSGAIVSVEDEEGDEEEDEEEDDDEMEASNPS